MSESDCEDAAIVLACDMRQVSLFAGLRDLLWFLLDIAFTNTRWTQGSQHATEVRQQSPAWRSHAEDKKKQDKSRQHWHH